MMDPVLRIPGVYVQERRPRATRALPTGVPVFLGLITEEAAMPEGTAPDADMYGPTLLLHKTEFLGGAAAYLADAVNGFFDNGGGYCYVLAIRGNPENGAD